MRGRGVRADLDPRPGNAAMRPSRLDAIRHILEGKTLPSFITAA
jgi:hypothetical protein